MLIVIPTYKRNDCLRWVLQSLVQCRVGKIPEPIRVLVVNNYPPAAAEIAGIVGEFSEYTRFEWQILYREKTLMPVDNWYSAIFGHALPDEVVFINSDDDLLLPLSLEARYLAITASKADMVLGKLGPNIFFSENGTKLLCLDQNIEDNPSVVHTIDYENLSGFSPQHLSNHCYRNTRGLRVAYEQAMSWCDSVTWLDFNIRTLFLPVYLPLALLLSKRNVIALQSQVILRGRDVEEIRKAPFGVPSWNHGFIHAVALIVMDDPVLRPLSQLNDLRISYCKQYIAWFPTYFFDKRLNRNIILKTQKAANIKWTMLLTFDLLTGLNLLIKDWLGLRGFKLSRLAKANSIPTAHFLQSIARPVDRQTGP